MGLLSLSSHLRGSIIDFVLLFHLGFFSIKRSLYLSLPVESNGSSGSYVSQGFVQVSLQF